ncbi:DUF3800 domain-containing protein [Albimonas sp. CAU 1670]|uniref:DUF3800 domain-containing protein n=1 Tax=Albimonas sp. CAU 1670 TaxID=3032599 RepID=UPI0023DBE652|nr:DUF3800 domain-containing protein [Albimonas sp. CAU 1670]MDF2235401.1 DUF3800 domain-containing protein [Albimonas sp. CAU 1670]
MGNAASEYGYVLYVDEAGDDGLKQVRPVDPEGASEWLCIGAVLVRAANEHEVVEWVREIRDAVRARQGPALHYRKLQPSRRLRAASILSEKPLRSFVVASNKQNMRGHRNERAAIRGGQQYFYNYCVRLLMERVTDFCAWHSGEYRGNLPYIRVIFSKRGGHSYQQTKAYWEILKAQASGNSTYLQKWQIRHETLRFGLVEYVSHDRVAGLQLADIVASAFYQAADARSKKWDIEPAKALRPRIALEPRTIRPGQVAADYGVVLQPTSKRELGVLTAEQRKIFQFYGYDI